MMTRVRIVALMGLVLLAGCSGNKQDKTPVRGERIPVLAFEQQIDPDPMIADLKVTLPAPYENADWAQPGGAPGKAMHHLALPARLSRAWRASIGDGSSKTAQLVATPVVADGKLFAIDTQARVVALDARTGQKLWTRQFSKKKEGKSLAFGGGVSYGDGKLVATTGYGIVAALDPDTGAVLWSVDKTLPLRGGATVAQGRVFVLTQDNELYALSLDDGKELWDAAGIAENAGLLGAAPPAVSADTLVVGYSSGELNALRVENGRVTWQDSLSRTGRLNALSSLVDIDGAPVIDRGRVFAIGHGGRMAALELATGERVWEANLGGVHAPWVAGDFLYIVTNDSEVVCLTRRDGRIRWIARLQRYENVKKKKGLVSWAGPVLGGDRLVLTSSNGYVATLSPYTGDILSVEKLGDGTYLPPIIAGNTLYAITDDGDVAAYR